ncbi:hypothetical protein M8C21_011465 [Ambrosia artemisiifolia]|uniref:FLZ-type domain-containing protein n=1 Tax=Ambrosia artemisiifolia TaxID=4212 RepID=A0AAD5CDH2_AMBAR|nr:hypothetical protein M8C21_011465 [Ambrosia artemisiifolia]
MDSATITNNQSLQSITQQILFISHPTTGFGYPYYSRSGTFINGMFQEQQPHYLDSCSLCNKPLGRNRDIFMYRGDIPFCSVECREEQIEIDESKEKKRRLKVSMKASRKKEEREKSSKSSPDYAFCSDAVVAA